MVASSPEQQPDKEMFQIRLEIQRELIRDYLGFDPYEANAENTQAVENWITEYGEDFAKVFSELQQEIDLVSQYRDDPSGTVKKIEQKLEEIHTHH